MAKRIILIALAVMMLFVCAGCSMVSVNEERDGQRVVATVNGVDILKKDVVNQLNLYLMSYMGVGTDDSSYEQYYDTFAESYLEFAVLIELCRQKCEEFGIEAVTEDQQKEIAETIDSAKELAESIAKNNLSEEDYGSDEKYQAAIDAYVQNYLTKYGYLSGAQEEYLKQNVIAENIIEYLIADYDPTEDDVKAYYDQELKDQKQVIGEQLSSFTNFETNGTLLYTPEGISYVKYVYIPLDTDAQQEITNAKSDEKEALRAEKLKDIQATADEALAAAKADFDAAVKKYNPEDDAMLKEDSDAMTEGIRIYAGSSAFEGEVETAAETLAVGETSGLIATDLGYYIIQSVSKVESGEAKFEDVKDTLKNAMISEKKDSVFTTTSGEWLDEATIKYYKNRL